MVEIDTTNLDLKKKIILERWGSILKQEMITRVPKEYGTMAASIESNQEGNSVSVGTKGTPYALFVEYGTGSMTKAHGPHLPEAPVTEWAALRKRNEVGQGQTMPFARSSDFSTEEERLNVLKEAFR